MNITTNVSEREQREDYQNATLQGHNDEIAFSIATYVSGIVAETQEELAEDLRRLLTKMQAAAFPIDVAFEVSIGRAE